MKSARVMLDATVATIRQRCTSTASYHFVTPEWISQLTIIDNGIRKVTSYLLGERHNNEKTVSQTRRFDTQNNDS